MASQKISSLAKPYSTKTSLDIWMLLTLTSYPPKEPQCLLCQWKSPMALGDHSESSPNLEGSVPHQAAAGVSPVDNCFRLLLSCSCSSSLCNCKLDANSIRDNWKNIIWIRPQCSPFSPRFLAGNQGLTMFKGNNCLLLFQITFRGIILSIRMNRTY